MSGILRAQTIMLRREAIEEYLNTSSSDADEVYVDGPFQKPIRDAWFNFWKDQIASQNGSPWMNYLRMDAPGNVAMSDVRAARIGKHVRETMDLRSTRGEAGQKSRKPCYHAVRTSHPRHG